MSAARKPRPIGPQSMAQDEAAQGAEAEFDLGTFLAGLSAGDLMDLDEASGGAIARMTGRGDEPVTLKLLFAVAWIVRRREEPRLTFRQVRAMNPQELAGVLSSLGGGGPKAGSAPV